MESWRRTLPLETIQLANELAQRAAAERATGQTIYPAQENIFRALDLTPPERVCCCILGQVIFSTHGVSSLGSFSACFAPMFSTLNQEGKEHEFCLQL